LDRHFNDKHRKVRKYHCTQPGCPYSVQGGKAFPSKGIWRQHMQDEHQLVPETDAAAEMEDEGKREWDPTEMMYQTNKLFTQRRQAADNQHLATAGHSWMSEISRNGPPSRQAFPSFPMPIHDEVSSTGGSSQVLRRIGRSTCEPAFRVRLQSKD
jgi:hypothetical protein